MIYFGFPLILDFGSKNNAELFTESRVIWYKTHAYTP